MRKVGIAFLFAYALNLIIDSHLDGFIAEVAAVCMIKYVHTLQFV
jgi:hypothetical protein